MGDIMPFKNLKVLLAIFALFLWAAPAHALSLEEAGVEKGEAEVEYEGSYTDDNGEGAYEHEHEIQAELGVTDWLKLGLEFGFEEEEGERSFEFTEVEVYATIELIDPENGGFGLALYGRATKEFEADNDEPDENTLAVGVIAEKHWDKWLFRGNLFYITDINGHEEQQFDGVEYTYQAKYKFSDRFGIGVEGYGTHADFDDPAEDDTNTHMVGPVLYLKREGEHETGSMKDADEGEEEGLELEASVGVLFGTNDETADVTLKWNLGLEF